MFLRTLGQAADRTGWRILAWVLMPNHYHLALETPEPNLVSGMHWLQGTYTTRFNLRHEQVGHLLQGRYKAILVQGRSPSYLQTLLAYILLNPVRAHLVEAAEILSFRWSSARDMLRAPAERPTWFHAEPALTALGQPDTVSGRQSFGRWLLDQAATETETESEYRDLRRGWCFGDDAFRSEMARKIETPTGPREGGPAIRTHDATQAMKFLADGLARLGLDSAQVERLPWTDPRKAALAWLLRSYTMTRNAEVAAMLGGGCEASVSRAVHQMARHPDSPERKQVSTLVS